VSSESVVVPACNFFDDYLNEEQFAAGVGRDLRTIRRWHALRIGPPRIKLGKKILYRKSSVALWLERKESHPCRDNEPRRSLRKKRQ
jgi:hypothetical protein